MDKIFFTIATFLLLSGIASIANSVENSIYVVDVEKVLVESNAAKQGRKHLAQARTILEKGYEDLRNAWSTAQQNEKNVILSDGANKLIEQLILEEKGVNNIILKIMRNEVKKWRQEYKAQLIIPLQNILEIDNALDITDEIINRMNKIKPEFAALPVITVKGPTRQNKINPAEQAIQQNTAKSVK